VRVKKYAPRKEMIAMRKHWVDMSIEDLADVRATMVDIIADIDAEFKRRQQVPDPTEPPAIKPITLEVITAKAKEFHKAGYLNIVKELLAEFKIKHVKELKPGQYSLFYEFLGDIPMPLEEARQRLAKAALKSPEVDKAIRQQLNNVHKVKKLSHLPPKYYNKLVLWAENYQS